MCIHMNYLGEMLQDLTYEQRERVRMVVCSSVCNGVCNPNYVTSPEDGRQIAIDSLNKKQISYILKLSKDITQINNKVRDVQQKFFADRGVLGLSNPNKSKELSISVFRGTSGQSVTLKEDMLPIVRTFVGDIEKAFMKELTDISAGKVIETLIKLGREAENNDD